VRGMSAPSNIAVFRRFVEETTGRLSFGQIERRFEKALDENPVFAEINKSGALNKNIIVILGGRGCGKTLLLRYIKYKLINENWQFEYVNGADVAKLRPDEAKKRLEGIMSKYLSEDLMKDPNYRIAIAIDDVAEVNEIASEQLKNIIAHVKIYEGKFKLILAAQSESQRTMPLLSNTLPLSPFAETLFGEKPEQAILDSFKSSYIKRKSISLFRGAALINLDAYWSSLRSLSKIEDLAEVIVKIVNFYIKNAFTDYNDGKAEIIDKINKVKHGLAFLALSSLPKISSQADNIIIEYKGGEDRALNGLGIAELISKLFADSELELQAEEAEEFYRFLKDVKTDINVNEVEEVLLKACPESGYMTPLKDSPISSIIPVQILQQPSQQQAKAGAGRKRGPKANIIEVRIRSGGLESLRYIIMSSLRTDPRGYVASESVKRIGEFVKLGVPAESEQRFLIVFIPTCEEIKNLYKAVGYDHRKRIGRDILPICLDGLSDIEKAFIRFVKSETIHPTILRSAYKLVIGTLLLNLRDNFGMPSLAYLMLPYVA